MSVLRNLAHAGANLRHAIGEWAIECIFLLTDETLPRSRTLVNERTSWTISGWLETRVLSGEFEFSFMTSSSGVASWVRLADISPRARFVSKVFLFLVYLMANAGYIEIFTCVQIHFAYIVASTFADGVEEWRKENVDLVRWTHHVATTWLMAVFAVPVDYSNEMTLQLLGAVDATDAFLYLFQTVRHPIWKLVAQVIFLLVWVARRILIWGPGDWGGLLLELHARRLEARDWQYMIFAYPPMGLLLATNYAWTWQIMVAVWTRVRRLVCGRE
jgi:hypothetical protein